MLRLGRLASPALRLVGRSGVLAGSATHASSRVLTAACSTLSPLHREVWREQEAWMSQHASPLRVREEEWAEDVQRNEALLHRQLDVELRTLDEAVEDYREMLSDLTRIRKQASLRPVQRLLLNWYEPLTDAIAAEQRAVEEKQRGMDRRIYGPFLMLLKPEKLAVITMHEALNGALTGDARFVTMALEIAKAVQAEVNVSKIRKNKKLWRMLNGPDRKLTIPVINQTARAVLHSEDWPTPVLLKLGSCLMDLLFKRAEVTTEDGESVPAFCHALQWKGKSKSVGVIQLHDEVSRSIEDGHALRESSHLRYLPMLVPPRPWTRYDEGGYISLRTSVMRTRGSKAQLDVLRKCEMPQVLEALNALSAVQWRINRRVLDTVLQVWDGGGGLADVPSRTNLELPPPPGDDVTDAAAAAKMTRKREKVEQKNRDLHSLRCDLMYKLEIAKEFVDDVLYFPYNVDFRGRAYPIPPNLNHLGADVCRALLLFAEEKPLGPSGLRWLKIHLANLMGVDKTDFDEREAYIDRNLEAVMDSADQPLTGSRWWLGADDPWQALATSMDITDAIRSGDPASYLSRLPVHQDGSCNGLQHYAALGQDEEGGFQVNLLPSERPQDVYTGVAVKVRDKVAADAVMTPTTKEQESDHLYAKIVDGIVDRKVVKQTVMTSVYGVTFVGARQQIMNRLEDKADPGGPLEHVPEELLYGASCYLARITLASLGELFTGARAIMEWLADCAKLVAAEGQPMSWITPLGLPVVQPYRRNASHTIRTLLQSVVVADHNDQLPVSGVRQRSAFPPNYVHSLDSTHMLMTALDCSNKGLTFAAVHDSYWTHGGTMEVMNESLRSQFVKLHSQPLLEELRESLVLRFPSLDFPPVPDRGTLELHRVRESPYFFA